MKLVSCGVLGALLLGCSPSSQPEYPELDTPLEPEPGVQASLTVAEAAPPLELPSGSIHRADLTRVVDAGLGLFLQHVEVDAALEAGQFRGFRIVSLTPPEFWAGIDLRPGDVVTQINGMSIERPPEAYRAFTSLKTAKELVVSYTREGQPRQLVFPIRPAVATPTPSSPAVEAKSEG